ncbi:MAG: hypothetical protein EPO00_09650 [Chloroflexota bacterium]|nr:MAG: hypothetical protein EPO00_09650 [Chloroflexota bacterium]
MSRDQNAVVMDRAALEREVERIVSAVAERRRVIRVLGSIAVALHCPNAGSLIAGFKRTYADIDFVAYGRDAKEIAAAIGGLGYIEDRQIFIFSEGRRAIFDHPSADIHIDVFYDRLEFCHVIPLDGRLEADAPTIPLAELLLSKLQIVKLNEKDVVDAILLLLDHPLASGDADTIDVDRIATLAAAEWGLWRTLTMNLEKVGALAATYPQLDAAQREGAAQAVTKLKAAIDAVPKPLAWRMRDRVGDRRQWWTDVDEVR